jgi:two-component system, response regulator, stage 0 sporulation protein F
MIKLLAVDDEPGICNIIKKTFRSIGFTVYTATNGKDAVALVKKERPKIVFLDILMPGMSGLEVLREIKKLDTEIRAIMVTVVDDEKIKKEARQLGADEFITKPFMPGYLEDVVRTMIPGLLES